MTLILAPNPPDGAQRLLATSLFRAIREWNLDEVFRLTPLIEDLDSHDYYDLQESPLLFAARQDLPCSAFELLLPRSNPLKKNTDNTTALMLAAWGNELHTPDLIGLLLPLSDPLARGKGGGTALHFSIEAGEGIGEGVSSDANARGTSLLLPFSDLEQRNIEGLTPLELARKRNERAVNLILGEMARRDALEISMGLAAPAGQGGFAARL